MVRRNLIVGLVLAFVAVGYSQMTPEEAQRRLEQRRIAATQSETETLRKLVSAQHEIIVKLQSESAILKKTQLRPFPLHQPMNKNDAISIMGTPETIISHANGDEELEWTKEDDLGYLTKYLASFQNGQLVSYKPIVTQGKINHLDFGAAQNLFGNPYILNHKDGKIIAFWVKQDDLGEIIIVQGDFPNDGESGVIHTPIDLSFLMG